MDTFSPEERSRLMSLVRSKDTKPEMIVRRLVHGLGYRYRLHAKDVPGTPDLVFRPRRKAIFVHGCFWHRHRGCPRTTTPKTRVEFWQAKFDRNRRRDRQVKRNLTLLGWKYLVVWECEIRGLDDLAIRLKRFLDAEDDPS